MIIPNDGLCEKIIDEMYAIKDQLTDWELKFVQSNRGRLYFTDPQKATIAKFCNKYEFDCVKNQSNK